MAHWDIFMSVLCRRMNTRPEQRLETTITVYKLLKLFQTVFLPLRLGGKRIGLRGSWERCARQCCLDREFVSRLEEWPTTAIPLLGMVSSRQRREQQGDSAIVSRSSRFALFRGFRLDRRITLCGDHWLNILGECCASMSRVV
jgi:hypothetical protein